MNKFEDKDRVRPDADLIVDDEFEFNEVIDRMKIEDTEVNQVITKSILQGEITTKYLALALKQSEDIERDLLDETTNIHNEGLTITQKTKLYLQTNLQLNMLWLQEVRKYRDIIVSLLHIIDKGEERIIKDLTKKGVYIPPRELPKKDSLKAMAEANNAIKKKQEPKKKDPVKKIIMDSDMLEEITPLAKYYIDLRDCKTEDDNQEQQRKDLIIEQKKKILYIGRKNHDVERAKELFKELTGDDIW